MFSVIPNRFRSPVVAKEIIEDHTAFQTFLLHGVPIGIPNDTLDRVRELSQQLSSSTDKDPATYRRRIDILFPDAIDAPNPTLLFSILSDECKVRLLPNLAMLILLGRRSHPSEF